MNFDPSGRFVAVSCSDGIIYIYTFTETEPELVRKIDGIIPSLETDNEATSRVVWHPDGSAFAAAEATRDIAVVSSGDWTKQGAFTGGHNGDITALAWSPNGALLASAGADGQILLWETRTQNILRRYDFANVINLAWHPTDNALSFTTSDGELFIHENFVPSEYKSLLEKLLEVAPLRREPISVAAGIPNRTATNQFRNGLERRQRRASLDSLDDILGNMDEGDDFIEDDDGAGYAEDVNGFGKRTNAHLDGIYGHENKRRLGLSWQPRKHAPFQPGSTPWRGNRRYLCRS